MYTKAFLALLLSSVSCYHNINDFGARHNAFTLDDQVANAKAFKDALLHANQHPDDRMVYIPEGHIYAMMPTHISNLQDVSIKIDGLIEVSEDYQNWPLKDGKKELLDFWTIEDS